MLSSAASSMRVRMRMRCGWKSGSSARYGCSSRCGLASSWRCTSLGRDCGSRSRSDWGGEAGKDGGGSVQNLGLNWEITKANVSQIRKAKKVKLPPTLGSQSIPADATKVHQKQRLLVEEEIASSKYPGKFPWRQEPPERRASWWKTSTLLLAVSGIIQPHFEGSHRRALHYLRHEFLIGAEIAFKKSVASIFEIRGGNAPLPSDISPEEDAEPDEAGGEKDTRETTEPFDPKVDKEKDQKAAAANDNSSDSDPSAQEVTTDDNQEKRRDRVGEDGYSIDGVVDPSDVMEPNLANFFTSALASCKASGCTIHYSLGDGSSERFGRGALLDVGIKRARLYWGLVGREDPESAANRVTISKSFGLVETHLYLPSGGRPDSFGHRDISDLPSVLQLDVALEVLEGFHVKEMNGDLVQGKEEPTVNQHVITLETAICPLWDFEKWPPLTMGKNLSWTIVGIDGWERGVGPPFPPPGIMTYDEWEESQGK